VNTIAIRGRLIGEGYPAYIIAEMSANHAGSIDNAKKIIRAAKNAGADCVKIQTYTADTLTIDCNNEYFSISNGLWEGETLYSLYGKAYTPWEWHAELKLEAEGIGMDFFSTPFDNTSVDFLEDIGVDFYKIASFELVDIPLLEYVASKGKPIILSTGMASFDEIQDAVNAIRAQGNDVLALLKCSSSYPAVPDDMNLRTMRHISESFNVPVGLSDHSLGSIGAVTAVAMGACIIEKHFCLSREIKNPDAAFSMQPAEFAKMVEDIRTAEKAMGAVSYEVSDKEKDSIKFRRSIFAVRDIKKGELLTKDNIRCIRPGQGLKPKHYKSILGRTATTDILRGTPMQLDMADEKRRGE
jgi:pseudaminic acid synthase